MCVCVCVCVCVEEKYLSRKKARKRERERERERDMDKLCKFFYDKIEIKKRLFSLYRLLISLRTPTKFTMDFYCKHIFNKLV